jgi:hypothetical protein
MTRKHYIKIARIIKDCTHNNYEFDNIKLVNELCIMFKEDNSLFDRQRFIEACE